MAKAGRCDDVVFGGKDDPFFCDIKVTLGESPLPSEHGGVTIRCFSEEELIEKIAAVEEKLTAEDLAIIQVAAAYKADQRYGNTFRAKCVGKSTLLDLTGAASAISIG